MPASAHPPGKESFYSTSIHCLTLSYTYFFRQLPRPGFSGDHREKFMRPVTQMKYSFWVSFFCYLSFILSVSSFWFSPAFFLFPFLSLLFIFSMPMDKRHTSSHDHCKKEHVFFFSIPYTVCDQIHRFCISAVTHKKSHDM